MNETMIDGDNFKVVKDEWIIRHPNGEGEKRLTIEFTKKEKSN